MDFYTLKDKNRTEIKIKRSRFIGTLKPVTTIDEAKAFFSEMNSEFKTANHNCWAYIVGDSGETFHSSDAGEPAGTAGKPILQTMQKHNLSNVACVVTRFFGGVKLGIRGLIDAYSESVEETVKIAELKRIVNILEFKVELSYSFADTFLYNANNMNAVVMNQEYSDVVKITLACEEDLSEELDNYIAELSNRGSLAIL